jgi:hypothetical protein
LISRVSGTSFSLLQWMPEPVIYQRIQREVFQYASNYYTQSFQKFAPISVIE